MHMTRLPGVPDRADAIRGMAHFAGSGPEGKTCGDCRHRGYSRLTRDEDHSWWHRGCEMYRRLTGRFGPRISRDLAACRYFEEKPGR